jgi:hypothetical protein
MKKENVYLVVAIVICQIGIVFSEILFEGHYILIQMVTVAMVTIGFYCMVQWGKKYLSSKIIGLSKYSLPNSFLELNSELRKKALDFAWTIGLARVVSIPIRTTFLTVLKFISLFGVSMISLIFIILTLVTLTACGERGENSYSSETCEKLTEKREGYIFFYWLGISGICCYYIFEATRLKAIKEEEEKAKYNQKLKDLAVRFIQSNYQTWINEMDKIAKSQSLKEAKVDPKHTFILFSSDFSIQPSEMPPRKLSVTYIFSDGFISIVSNIVFDILQTSYSYVFYDTPEFSITSHDNWTIEEFHYKDIVELTYKPVETPSESIKTPTGEYPVAGYLIIKLVNGSKKEYPTTKKDATNFIDLAREKVREAKRSSV